MRTIESIKLRIDLLAARDPVGNSKIIKKLERIIRKMER
jgi:hypothetical protein